MDSSLTDIVEKLADKIADQLISDGFCVFDNPVPEEWLSPLEQKFIETKDQFKKSKMGRGFDQIENAEMRGDWTLWLTETDGTEVFKFLTHLQTALNHRLFWGLKSFECHLASYPPGSGYTMHVDNPKGSNARQLTFLAYLNREWTETDGGELEIFSSLNQKPLRKISPIWNRWVFFLSEKFPHQVLPAGRPRHSLSGWYRHD